MKSKLSLIALVLLAGVTAAQAAHPASGCSNKDLAGVYGMLATGTIIIAPGFPATLLGPFARVGRVVADGNGNISVANTASYNGNIIPESYSGTYTVNSDCSVDIRPVVGLPLGPGGSLVPVPFEFVGALADNGNSAAVVLCGLGPGVPCFPAPMATGNVIRVLLSKQDDNRSICQTKNLSGAFQLDMAGSVIAGGMPEPFARDGLLAFDGRGGFSGHATVSSSGLPVLAEDITGTYSVDSLCNVSIAYSLAGAHTWSGTLSNQSNAADLIVAETGSIVSGTLRAVKSGNGDEFQEHRDE